MEDLGDITDRKEQERDRIAELESKIENREERIAELESELETARDVSAAARKMANALAHGDGAPPDSYQSTLQTKNEQIERLESRLAELESKVGDAESTVAADEAPVDSTTETGEESTADEESAPAVDSPEGTTRRGDSAFVFDETADEEGGRTPWSRQYRTGSGGAASAYNSRTAPVRTSRHLRPSSTSCRRRRSSSA